MVIQMLNSRKLFHQEASWVVWGLRMAKGTGSSGIKKSLNDLWEKHRDRHLPILSTTVTVGGLLVLTAIFHLAMLSDSSDWEEYTPLAWIILASGAMILFLVTGKFIEYIEQYNLLSEVLKTSSNSEVKRMRSDAESAAKMLGSRHQERLDSHLINLGLKKSR